MKTTQTLLLLLSILVALPAFAAPSAQSEHAKLTLHVDASPDASGIFWAAIEVKLEEGWHIYWQNPGDSGLEAQIKWHAPEGIADGGIHWLPPQRIAYESLYNYGYEEHTALLVPFKLSAEALPEGELKADIEYLICKDVCIPESASLSAPLAAGSPDLQKQLARWREQLPERLQARAEYDISGEAVYFAFDLAQTTMDLARIYHAWWYPIDAQVIANASEQQWRMDGSTLILSVAREGTASPEAFRGVLEVATTDGQRFHFYSEAAYTPAAGALPTDIALGDAPREAAAPADAASMTLWLALFSAFLGGIILNLMPCVLPVLSLKALSIAKKSGAQRAQIRREGYAYTLGILLSFLAVAGTLMALQAAGQSIGWGFQLQSAAFVSALIYLLFVIGLNLSGAFEVPSALAGIGAKLTHKDGAAGSFFTGVLATIVATPCTAPFMAGAIGFALTQPPLAGLLIFAMLGLGLAFPFLLITLIPAATRYLPTPGAWMQTLRELLAFPMYGTVIWLLWVLVQQTGSMGLLHTLCGLLMIGFTIWLLGKISHRAGQFMLLAAAVAGLILITDTVPANDAMPSHSQSALQAQAFSEDALEAALADGKRVFVNATAAWCITCKVNERVALRDARVMEALSADDLVYFIADWTNRNDAISQYLASFGRNGVPMYAYYAPSREPVLLPQLLTPSVVLETLQGDAS